MDQLSIIIVVRRGITIVLDANKGCVFIVPITACSYMTVPKMMEFIWLLTGTNSREQP